MKRIAALFMLLALFTGLAGCNFPTPAPPTTTVLPGITPSRLPSFTPPPPTQTGSPGQPGITPPPPPTFTPLPPTVTPAASSGAITLDMLKNFTYTVESATLQVPLQNGVYQGDHVNSRLVEPVAFGDLNGDGRPDAAVILATNLGGSGTFFDLVAVLDQNGTPVQAGYDSFGDRQGIKGLRIENGRVVLDYLTQGLKDPLCCPSEHRLRSYLLDGGVLRLASEQLLVSETEQATPVPDAILIDQPAMLARLASPLHVRGRVSQVPPEKKLEYDVTNRDAVLLLQGEVPLQGEPGGPGTFDFTITLDPQPAGIIKLELIDAANGILRGRSMVELLAQ